MAIDPFLLGIHVSQLDSLSDILVENSREPVVHVYELGPLAEINLEHSVHEPEILADIQVETHSILQYIFMSWRHIGKDPCGEVKGACSTGP